MNKKGLFLIIAILILITISINVIVFTILENKAKGNKNESIKGEDSVMDRNLDPSKINIVPTMNDKITSDNASWSGTFQLVWNDMKNEIVEQDIVFDPQIEMAENLNKEDFNEKMLSDEYYYKTFGIKTLELKEKIEKAIKEKFNQNSDILDDFDWSEDALDDPNNPFVTRYFLYTMLYREFDFLSKFDELEKGKFGKNFDDIKYFGISEETNEKVRDQIRVLYYNSNNDFAILVETKNNDELIYVKNPNGNTFNEIYENMNKESDKYNGSMKLSKIDKFKSPYLDFDEKIEYTDIQKKVFPTKDGEAVIEKAIQTIKFSLDEKGGTIKSEAGIDMIRVTSALISEDEKPRYFYLDDTFTMFLREKGKELPYFASKIQDISLFQ